MAARRMSPRSDHLCNLDRAAPRRGRWRAAGAVGLLLGLLALAACGQSMEAQLPDLSTKSATGPGVRPPLSAADQKRAIDELIAKRDSQNQAK